MLVPLYLAHLVIAELLLLQGTSTSWILGRRKKITPEPQKRLLDKQKLFIETLYKNIPGERETHAFVLL